MGGHYLGAGLLAASRELDDPGDGATIVMNDDHGVCPIVTAGAETRVLPEPDAAGKVLFVYLLTDGGDCVITAINSGTFNDTGNNTITLDTAGDGEMLFSTYDGTNYHWKLPGGSALSTV